MTPYPFYAYFLYIFYRIFLKQIMISVFYIKNSDDLPRMSQNDADNCCHITLIIICHVMLNIFFHTFYLKRPNLICLFHFKKRNVSMISILFIICCSLSLSISLSLSLSLYLFLSFSLSLSLYLSHLIFIMDNS